MLNPDVLDIIFFLTEDQVYGQGMEAKLRIGEGLNKSVLGNCLLHVFPVHSILVLLEYCYKYPLLFETITV